MCGGMLVGALGICMIQIWPLWLKIGVWWCSVTFLTTFGILCVVRLILFVLMWIVGFRGIVRGAAIRPSIPQEVHLLFSSAHMTHGAAHAHHTTVALPQPV